MRKFIAGAALALIVTGAGSTAFAGEIGGSGKPTPIKTRHGRGLDLRLQRAGRRQRGWAGRPRQRAVVRVDRRRDGQGRWGVDRSPAMIRGEGPGTNCRGNLGGEEG